MPVSGKVIETSKKLLQTPSFIGDAPYGEGGMVKIEMTAPTELENLLSAE